MLLNICSNYYFGDSNVGDDFEDTIYMETVKLCIFTNTRDFFGECFLKRLNLESNFG